MDIKHLNPLTARTQDGGPRKVGDASEKGRSESRDDSTGRTTGTSGDVKIGKGITQLATLMDQIDSEPVRREDRIARLKQAIEDGSYQVNSQSVARKLLQTEALFSKL